MIRLLLIGLALLASATAARAAPDAPQLNTVQAERLVAPDGRMMAVERGFLRVPERRDRAAPGGVIELAVMRLRWADVTSPVVNMVLAGGPGDSGTGLLSGISAARAAALLDLTGGDVIAFDQRGSGRSRPSLALPERTPLPLEAEGSPALWLPVMADAARAAARRFEARGVRLASYTSAENADDVDAVRRAFGYATMHVWGRSYGSHLALATVRRHPGSVARLILVSPEGPDHTYKLPALTDAVIARIAERAGVPELPATIRMVIARLRREPVMVEVAGPDGVSRRVTIGAFDMQWLTAQALGDPRTLATLPAAYREMAAGDFRGMGAVALAARSQWRLGSGMKYMMDLASHASPARLRRIEREARTALLGNAINFPLMGLRKAWPAVDLGGAYREPVRSAVPTLILVGDLDARTPVENAREIARGLSHAQVVVVENAAHQFDLFGDAVLRPILQEFVAGRAVTTQRVKVREIGFQR